MTGRRIESAVVNGPLGAVGLALTECLLEKGVHTYAVCCPGDPRIAGLPEGAEIIETDMREIENLKGRIRADAFFHLAWMGTIGPGRNDAAVQTENIRCAVLAAKTAKELGCRVFVGAGSQAEYGRIEGKVKADDPCFPLNGYGIAKLCAGQMTRLVCSREGVDHVWARILSVYGPGDGPLSVIPTILEKLTHGKKPALTPGEQMWDFCYSADAAEALWAMAVSGKNGGIYPVGSGRARPLREYFELVRDAVDPSLQLGIGELPYPENQVMHLEADLTPLEQDTGFRPKVPFEEGIRRTVRAWQERMNR